jgi:hypothetical protein|tara:strand:- start:24 stop:314 length:291 start_codon:yes stop_codon:yes gene_type:complete
MGTHNIHNPDEKLRAVGFNIANLTQEQKELINQPYDAPENYYMDGEVTPLEADRIWKENLKNSGLTSTQILKAIKLHSYKFNIKWYDSLKKYKQTK